MAKISIYEYGRLLQHTNILVILSDKAVVNNLKVQMGQEAIQGNNIPAYLQVVEDIFTLHEEFLSGGITKRQLLMSVQTMDVYCPSNRETAMSIYLSALTSQGIEDQSSSGSLP